MAAKKASATLRQPPASFEEAVSELEKTLETLEEGTPNLEESLRLYERSTFLLEWCRKTLAEAEQRIEQLHADEPGPPEPASDHDTA